MKDSISRLCSLRKILIDGEATINIMPHVMCRKLGKGDQDLTKTDMMQKDFEGKYHQLKGLYALS